MAPTAARDDDDDDELMIEMTPPARGESPGRAHSGHRRHPAAIEYPSPWNGKGLSVTVICALYGLAMNGARNVFYTQKPEIKAGLGVTDAEISNTLAAGYLVYACGKLLYGFATDRVGGKTIYVYCFAGVGLVTMAFWFARSGVAMSTLWIASRFFQPAGYLGQSKLVANWFVHTELAWVMAWLSVFHYLFDALTRLGLSVLFNAGLGWRDQFLICGAVSFSVAAAAMLLLHATPQNAGLDPPPTNPHSLKIKRRAGGSTRLTVLEATKRLLGSGRFCLVLVGAMLVGTLREIFETSLSDFLMDSGGASHAKAVFISACFPLCGIPGIIASGYLVDKYDRRRNGRILVMMCLPLAGLCIAMWQLVAQSSDSSVDLTTAGLLSAGIGLFAIGPHSLFLGVLAVDIGGAELAGLAVGFSDFAGYLGSVIFFFVRDKLPGVHETPPRYDTVMALVACCGVGSLLLAFCFLSQDTPPPPRVNSSRHLINTFAEEDRAPLLLPGSELLDIPESLLEGEWVLSQRKD